MRTFTIGSGGDAKTVVIDVEGTNVGITERKADGTATRRKKELKSTEAAKSAMERMAQELLARGYVEQRSAAKPVRPASKPAAQQTASSSHAFDDIEAPPARTEPVLARLATAPAEKTPKKKKKSGGQKKRQQPQSADSLDKRVLAGVALLGIALVAGGAFFVYDSFLKPPTIVGTWGGSRTEHEISKSLTHTTYHLVLDEQKRASMSIQESSPSSGTYSLEGNRLKLTLKDEDGDTVERQYKITLGHTTLDLFDPESGKKVVQLVRLTEKPSVGPAPAPAAAPKDLASGAGDPAADAALASVSFSPKDGAFKIRHPQGWEAETGSRPDNTYSWARFTKGSAKIQVFADVQGSLMSGSDVNRDQEEGSEFAPVHNAHELYQKTAAKEYSDYKESEPGVFKGSSVGEGRVATFSASTGGILGTKLKGYRITLLTNNRRISILCECPERDFEKLKPTFLAVSRSVSN
jgi:hypothetical protein